MCLRTHRGRPVGFRHSRSSLRSGSHIRIERPRLARCKCRRHRVLPRTRRCRHKCHRCLGRPRMCLRTHRGRPVGFRHSRSSLRSGSHIRIERPRLARCRCRIHPKLNMFRCPRSLQPCSCMPLHLCNQTSNKKQTHTTRRHCMRLGHSCMCKCLCIQGTDKNRRQSRRWGQSCMPLHPCNPDS